MVKFLGFQIKLEKNSKMKVLIGLLLAAASIFCWQIWFPGNRINLAISVLFAVLFLAIGLLKLQANTNRAARFLNILWGICAITATIAASLPIDFTAAYLDKALLNLLCAAIVAACLFAVTASWRPAINLTVVVLALLLGVNLIVYAFRGKEMTIADFLAAKTALSVVDQYTFEMNQRFLLLCSCVALAVFSQFAIPAFPRRKVRPIRNRVAAVLAAGAMFALLSSCAAGIPVESWGGEGTRCNGYLLNFYLGTRNLLVQEPEHYSPEAVEEYSAAYKTETAQSENKPNIIIIMDESFSDLNIYERELTTNIPATPFIDSLSENTVRGYALASVFGAQTANSEFEVLTGHTMGFLSADSTPYQHYIFDRICSLPWVLDSYGYVPFATHPYHHAGWSRSTVYPHLGLGNNTFIDDYPNEKLVRSFISDQEMFEYVLDRLDEDRNGEPLFLVGITMQNHGGYRYSEPDFTETVHLEGFSQTYRDANQYLSLLNETDRAVEYLLGQLQNYPEDTIVLFFGDHQPNVGTAFYSELNGGAIDTLDEIMTQYTVPFFIWANFDIEEKVVPCTSLNYLPRYLLEYAGLELPTYYRILKDLEEAIPAINAFGYYSLEKGRFATFDEAEGKEAELLQMYENIQYNNMFDEENRNYELFGQYLNP